MCFLGILVSPLYLYGSKKIEIFVSDNSVITETREILSQLLMKKNRSKIYVFMTDVPSICILRLTINNLKHV